jgi:Transglutaminase-like superfamily
MSVGISIRRFRTLATSGIVRQALVIEACSALLHARLILLAVPFQQLALRWGRMVPIGDTLTSSVSTRSEDIVVAKQIAWAVAATASVMPFKAMCLQQAVAARAMLARRGVSSVLHYGAGRDQKGKLIAHAWLDVGFIRVTGYPVAPNIAEICAFVPR